MPAIQHGITCIRQKTCAQGRLCQTELVAY